MPRCPAGPWAPACLVHVCVIRGSRRPRSAWHLPLTCTLQALQKYHSANIRNRGTGNVPLLRRNTPVWSPLKPLPWSQVASISPVVRLRLEPARHGVSVRSRPLHPVHMCLMPSQGCGICRTSPRGRGLCRASWPFPANSLARLLGHMVDLSGQTRIARLPDATQSLVEACQIVRQGMTLRKGCGAHSSCHFI